MNPWLIAGGVLSGAAALLHVGVIFGGPDWYRFFGAGEAMARKAEAESWYPPAVTAAIAAVLAVWAAYAFSGAGMIPRLPLLRTGLVAISAVYLLRGLVWVPLLIWRGAPVDTFAVWSSLIALAYGVAYAVGTWTAWRGMGAG